MTGLNPAFRAAVLAKRAGQQPDAARSRREPHPRDTPRSILAEARRLFAMAREDREAAAQLLAEARIEAAMIAEAARQARDAPIGPNLPDAAGIIRAVATRHGVRLGDIVSQRRDRDLVAARHEAIVLVRAARPDLSLPSLGRLFRRDHTSILHALRKAGKGGAECGP